MATRTKTPKPFGAIDGESYTSDDDHRYVLLMDSDRRYIFDEAGLSTKRCFDFLLGLDKKHIWTAFGLNYDVNMMLRDFGRKRLTELWDDGWTTWFGYRVEWYPGKWFYIRHFDTKRSIKIVETFGFFQTSFIKALEAWNIDHQEPAQLEAMKKSRGTFDDAMREEIIDYCHTETALLCRLMEELRANFHAVGIKPTSWIGAGAAAAALLRKHNVKKSHRSQTEWSPDVQRAIMHSYFGGRTELFQQGEFSEVRQYDIISAYPSAACEMPSLLGSWRQVTDYDPKARFAIWELEWDSQAIRIAPFPFRYQGRSICYPFRGRGFYHAAEVTAALSVTDAIRIKSGYVYEPESWHAPFNFIRETFIERAKLKAQGHAAHKCLKLALNSVYGKLAQGIGYRNQLPPFQNYYWAGFITAATRARVLNLIAMAPEDVIMVATDGIFYRSHARPPFSFGVGEGLGDLEMTMLTDVFTAQPGVYHGWSNGNEIRRSRGFFAREIDFDALREGFRKYGADHIGRYESTRFHGLGTSLRSKELETWRKWVTSERKLTLYPSVKVIDDPDARPIRHNPPAGPGGLSAPYVPKIGGYTDDELDYAQGKEQPLRD